MNQQYRIQDQSQDSKRDLMRERKQELIQAREQQRARSIEEFEETSGNELLDLDMGDSVTEDESYYGQDQIYRDSYDETIQTNEKVCLDLDHLEVISVLKYTNTQYKCHYEPPHWTKLKFSKEDTKFIRKRSNSLRTLAIYFNETQGEFLNNPIMENFQFTGGIKRNKFLKAVSEYGDCFNESDFSDIRKRIWFVWTDKSFCIESLFK